MLLGVAQAAALCCLGYAAVASCAAQAAGNGEKKAAVAYTVEG